MSSGTVRSVEQASQRSSVPAGAILFAQGQMPQGMFVLCTGSVNLFTTSREGNVLILETAEAGDAVGLCAAISGQRYEVTAEATAPCQFTFVSCKNLLGLFWSHSEIALHAAQCLSQDLHAMYQGSMKLLASGSSSGRLAKLLLGYLPQDSVLTAQTPRRKNMTHNEMSQRVGCTRETVTRALHALTKKQILGRDGTTLVIRDRTALEALAVPPPPKRKAAPRMIEGALAPTLE
jgi:CRP/FNR family transcriptional regulator, cyclic AMP receptor protein